MTFTYTIRTSGICARCHREITVHEVAMQCPRRLLCGVGGSRAVAIVDERAGIKSIGWEGR